MASIETAAVAGIARPVLARGELLSEAADLGGPVIDDDGWRAQYLDEAQRRLLPMLDTAIQAADEIPRHLRTARIVVEAAVLPNYLANTHFPRRLFEAIDVQLLGARGAKGIYRTPRRDPSQAPTKNYVLSVAPHSLNSWRDLLAASDDGGPFRDELIQFDWIAVPDSASRLHAGSGEVRTHDGLCLMESVLHPSLDLAGNATTDALELAIERWVRLVESLDGTIRTDHIREIGGLVFAPVAIPAAAVERAAAFNPLRTLRFMPEMRTLPRAGPERQAPIDIAVPTGDPPPGRIAVFDGGLEPTLHEQLDPWVSEIDLTRGTPRLPSYVAHGTQVVGAALFGSLDDPRPPVVGVDSFRVWPPPDDHRYDADLDWVLDQIVDVLETGSYRVAVISLAPRFNVSADSEPHRWTLELDRVAADTGVAIVVAAGNTGDLDEELNLNRVLVPADMVNGLAVGACRNVEAVPPQRAEYSSRGPGRPGASTTPTGIQFGGELASGVPFVGLAAGGAVVDTEGTSFAAPMVARGLAELAGVLGEASETSLLRAFCVHFAQRPERRYAATAGSAPQDVGYGLLPVDCLAHLDSGPAAVTIYYTDTMIRGDQVTLPIPIPSDLLESLGGKRVRVRYTLVYNTEVDATNPVDYGQGGFRMLFRPDSQYYTVFDPDRRRASMQINRRREPDRFANEIEMFGMQMSRNPVTRQQWGYAPEVQRRQDGKWETVVRVDQSMRASSLFEPAIDLHFLARERGRLTPTRPGAGETAKELRYTLLVTVEVAADVDLHTAVRDVVPALVPLAVEVPVRVPAV